MKNVNQKTKKLLNHNNRLKHIIDVKVLVFTNIFIGVTPVAIELPFGVYNPVQTVHSFPYLKL